MGLVTSLAANNADLQTNLVRNGVLWSLLLFLFDYDYTLDESGVNTSEESNQQKSANNLAKLSILSTVALCGYTLKLVLDPNDPLNSAIRSHNAVATSNASNSETNSATTSPQSSSYTSNATNLIQNNAVHATSMNSTTNKTANFTSYVGMNEKVSSSEEVFESEPVAVVEKENFANNQKYKISGNPTNSVVKKIADRLLTKYIADKLATHNDSEVLKLLTSNTRNPYMIWDNATRSQLIDFLEYQRTNSTKHQYEDITDIFNIAEDFSFDAHR